MEVYIVYSDIKQPENTYECANIKYYNIHCVRGNEDSAKEEAIALIQRGWRDAWYIKMRMR